MSSSRSPEGLPGGAALMRPAVLILLIALSERPRHGYRLLRDVEDIAHVRLGAATVYHSLRRMRADGLIEEVPGDRARSVTGRRVFRITDAGLRVAKAEVERLAIVVEAAAARGLLGADDLSGRNPGEDPTPKSRPQ
jgi:DNA-binding PadR family transcriptional regulator